MISKNVPYVVLFTSLTLTLQLTTTSTANADAKTSQTSDVTRDQNCNTFFKKVRPPLVFITFNSQFNNKNRLGYFLLQLSDCMMEACCMLLDAARVHEHW